MKGVNLIMRIRQRFQILSLLITPIIGLLFFSSNCYAEAFAYIPNSGDNNLSIIKVLDNSIIDTLAVGGTPFGVTVGEEYIYVTNSSTGTVSVISMSYNAIVKTLAAGASPKGIAVTSDGEYIYVANSTDNTLSAIDISTNLRKAVNIGKGPIGVALSPLQDYVYVTNSDDDSLSIISTSSNNLLVTLKDHYYLTYSNSSSDIAFKKPYGVAVSPDGLNVYVVNRGNNSLSILSAITVYSKGDSFKLSDYNANNDTGPYTLYAPIAVGNDPRCVVVAPDQSYLYVTNYGDNTVSVISLSTLYVTATISVGKGPHGISITPSGDLVYVVNELDETVSIIDVDTDSVIKTVNLGDAPVAFGNFIGGKPPKTPSNLTATLANNNTISINWSDNSDDELGFNIMRRRYVGGNFVLIATVLPGITSYTDGGLSNDSNYYYKVSAFNYAGESDFSNIAYSITGNSESGCFIATAAYGSLMEPHVKILRDFRNRFLSTNKIGKSFLALYYRYSPPIADFITQHDSIRFMVRWSLLPFVGMSWLVIFIGPASSLLILVTFICLMIFTIGNLKRRAARE
jgi:YVTN family beta-propeller protein